jgi:hypothetical protein
MHRAFRRSRAASMSQVALGMRIWSLVAYQSSHKEAWRRAEPGGKPTGKPIPQPASDAQISRSMQGLALRGPTSSTNKGHTCGGRELRRKRSSFAGLTEGSWKVHDRILKACAPAAHFFLVWRRRPCASQAPRPGCIPRLLACAAMLHRCAWQRAMGKSHVRQRHQRRRLGRQWHHQRWHRARAGSRRAVPSLEVAMC